MARLDITHPVASVRTVELEPSCVLGRFPGVSLRFDIDGVSRHHARFGFDGQRWTVIDLGSHNGTRLNGELVSSAALRHGDRLRFGSLLATFIAEPSVSESAEIISLSSFPPAAHVSDPDQLAADYELLRAAHDVAHVIGLQQDIEGVYQAALAFCAERLSVDTGYVLQRSPASFEVRATTGLSPKTADQTLPVSSTVLARLVQERRGFLLADAERETDGAVSVMVLGIESLLAVPLVVADEVVGAIVLHNHHRTRAFSRRELHVTSGIAAQVSLVLERLRLLDEVKREVSIRARFARFLPLEIVDELAAGRLGIEPGGREGQISVLYCDIRGFTPLSRSLGPGPTMDLLNAYYQACVPIVFTHGGMVDKFVGDELMAVWGVPMPREDDLKRAVACALALQEEIAALSRRREADGLAAFACGIGINSGPAWVGLVGAAERVQYTVIGDTVNLGARLCSEAFPGEIVTRRALISGVAVRFEGRPPKQLKGGDAPIELVRVVGG